MKNENTVSWLRIRSVMSAVDLQQWNETYKMALQEWMTILSIYNNVTATVLQLETSAEQITNHSETMASYGLRAVYVF